MLFVHSLAQYIVTLLNFLLGITWFQLSLHFYDPWMLFTNSWSSYRYKYQVTLSCIASSLHGGLHVDVQKNRIPNKVRQRLVRSYADYLMVADTLGVNLGYLNTVHLWGLSSRETLGRTQQHESGRRYKAMPKRQRRRLLHVNANWDKKRT